MTVSRRRLLQWTPMHSLTLEIQRDRYIFERWDATRLADPADGCVDQGRPALTQSPIEASAQLGRRNGGMSAAEPKA